MSLLSKGESFRIEVPQISIGLQWDILSNKSTDLDASCVLYNGFGKIQDAVYYNKLVSDSGGVVHSGDNKTGQGFGDDEVIDIDFGLIGNDVDFMMVTVCCHGGNFSDVETAKVAIRDFGGTQYCNIQIGSYAGYTGLVVCLLKKDTDGFWKLINNQVPSPGGRHFQHMAPIMRDILLDYIDVAMLNEGMHIEGKSFEMEKGDIFDIPDVSGVTVGLGWDFVGDPIDLDASVILFDNDAQSRDIVYFANHSSKYGGVVHSGDNVTGEGDGDDETISITFGQIDPEIASLVVVVNIYTSGTTFSQVLNPYIRLVANHQEICRYNLGSACGDKNGLLMSKFYRKSIGSDEWLVIAVGESAEGSMAMDTVEQIDEMGLVPNYRIEERAQLAEMERLKPYCIYFCIEEGRNLVAKDSNGFSDPYVKFKIKGTKGKTHKVKKTLNPVWNSAFDPIRMPNCDTINDLPPLILHLDVYDHDPIGKDFMGTCEVNLTQIIGGQLNTETSAWILLEPRQGKKDRVSGEIRITAYCCNRSGSETMQIQPTGLIYH